MIDKMIRYATVKWGRVRTLFRSKSVIYSWSKGKGWR
jgi:hypothetical protein